MEWLTEENKKVALFVLVSAVVLAVSIRLTLFSSPKGKKYTAKQVVDSNGSGAYLKGKTVIVTGGNSGIGLETCKALLSVGARVILCSRSVSAAEKAVKEEIEQPGEGGYTVNVTPANLAVYPLDLNSLRSVKKFATDFLAKEKRLDLLVCNAGIMALPNREETEDGFEKQIGVNHFGHAYLTSLLQDLLVSSGSATSPSRVVVLTSTAHDMGKIDDKDLHYRHGRKYGNWSAYGQSKLANLLFAKSLADKFKLAGSPVTAVSVHPGVIQTNLWRSTGVASGILATIAGAFIMDKTIPQGAATTVWACVSPEILRDENRGAYLADCAPAVPKTKSARDEKGVVREALWKATQEQLAEAIKKGGF